MKNPKTMTAGQINRERDRIAKNGVPKLNAKFIAAGKDPEIATCYLKANDPLDAEMIAIRARWYALQHEILLECGPGVSKFPPGFRRKYGKKDSEFGIGIPHASPD
jgi:hypothetical protein